MSYNQSILDKVLITGGKGMVGNYVDFGVKIDRELFDITNFEETLEAVQKVGPEVILHLAAETDLKRCEKDSVHAHLTNSVGTYNLAMVAKVIGAKMVYVSTDAVFPHSSKPHKVGDREMPESVYGHSKYLGELAVRGLSDSYIIARTSWIFGGGKEKDKKFVARIIGELDKPEANVVNDEYGSPTFARDLVNTLKQLIVEDKRGVFHVSNSGIASRYDMALSIATILKKETKILPVSASVFGLLPYQRSSGGLVANMGLRLWQAGLKEYLETEW